MREKLARGEARKVTSAATSSGSQMRPKGMDCWASSCARSWVTPLSRAKAFSSVSHRSVFTGPGLTVLMRTPYRPYCSATEEAKVTSSPGSTPTSSGFAGRRLAYLGDSDVGFLSDIVTGGSSGIGRAIREHRDLRRPREAVAGQRLENGSV